MNTQRNGSTAKLRIATGLFVAAMSMPLAARAQVSAPNIAGAETLFKEGVALVKAGNYADACPKFDASLKLDPTTNTMLRLADCQEHMGRTATAYGLYLEAADQLRATKDRREKAARERAANLEPKLSRMTIKVSPKMSSIESLSISCNDTPVLRALWGQPAPMDPGEPLCTATAEGHVPWEKKFKLDEAATITIDVPDLDPVPVKPPDDPNGTREPPPDSGMSGRKIAAIAVGAVGIIGIGVGGFFGLTASSQWDDALSGCVDRNIKRCNPTYVDLGKKAESSAMAATIATGVGLAGVAGGIILLVAAPKASAPTTGQSVQFTPLVSPGLAGGNLQFRF